jgi:hypothetical protein
MLNVRLGRRCIDEWYQVEVDMVVGVVVVVGLQIKSVPHAASIHCRCSSFLEEERRGEVSRGESR